MNLRPPILKNKKTREEDDLEGMLEESFPCVGVPIIRSPKAFQHKVQKNERMITFFTETLFQLFLALSIGATLIAPMLIMVLLPSLKTSLITTCVFVFGFAGLLVIFNYLVMCARAILALLGMRGSALDGLSLQAKDIIGATAAYTAVLVVFVGTSTSTATSK